MSPLICQNEANKIWNEINPASLVSKVDELHMVQAYAIKATRSKVNRYATLGPTLQPKTPANAIRTPKSAECCKLALQHCRRI